MRPAARVAAVQLRAQHRMHLLRLLGRGGLAGADGPDGLVGHHDLADAVAVDVDHGRQLALDDVLGRAGFALGQRLADADDGRDARASAALALSATSASVSPWYWRRSEWPTMRVAHAEFLQHGGRHLAGVGALLVRATRPARRAPAPSRHAASALAPGKARARRRRLAAGARRMPAITARTSASLAAMLPFIFQLPAMSFFMSWSHQVSTILPTCWFDSISAWALAACGGGKRAVDHRLDLARSRSAARRFAAATRRWRP